MTIMFFVSRDIDVEDEIVDGTSYAFDKDDDNYDYDYDYDDDGENTLKFPSPSPSLIHGNNGMLGDDED